MLYAGNGVSGTGVGGYGNVVVIQDKNNRAHVYAHLASVSVKLGQTVKKGDIIGKQGATGVRVTGSHLHYEVRKKSSPSLCWVDNPKARTLDPTQYVKEYYAADKPTVSQMADMIINNSKAPNGHENRRKWLGIDNPTYQKVRAEVNRRLSTPKSITQSIEQMANRIIIDTNAPTGHEACRKWLGIDNATYKKVRERVNQLMS